MARSHTLLPLSDAGSEVETETEELAPPVVPARSARSAPLGAAPPCVAAPAPLSPPPPLLDTGSEVETETEELALPTASVRRPARSVPLGVPRSRAARPPAARPASHRRL